MSELRDLLDTLGAPAPLHDPGGKVTTALATGMQGQAEFCGDRQQYRLWLSRTWGETTDPRFVMFIGMNPSTARADVNDPTITREIGFAKAWGYERLIKCNVMDYRATHPRDLLDVVPCSDQNIPTILNFARNAERIVMAYGALNKRLVPYAKDVVDALTAAGHAGRMYAFGYTLFGHPRHPLYLAATTPLEPYRWKYAP